MPVAVFPCFLHRRKSISNGVQMARNFMIIFYGPKRSRWALVAPGGCPEGGTTHQGAPGGPGAPWWVVPTSGAPRAASLLYKYPNIPETLGESTKINSSRRKFQKPQIQSRHHHKGVHHPHWCWKYALEAIINGYYYISLFMIIVYCSCYNCVIRKS